MITISEYTARLNESEEVNEGIFSYIRLKRALKKMSRAANDLYDAILRKYEVDIERSAFEQTKEWSELSRAAKMRKREAFNQKFKAAEDLVSASEDKCMKLLGDSSHDDNDYYIKAYDIYKSAVIRAKEEAMNRAEEEIRSSRLNDLATEWDEEQDELFGRIVPGATHSTSAKEANKLRKESIKKEQDAWRERMRKEYTGEDFKGKIVEVPTDEYNKWNPDYWMASDRSDCLKQDDKYYNIRSEMWNKKFKPTAILTK